MRKYLMFASLTTLAACGGGGPQTASGTAIVSGSNPTSTAGTFVTPTETKTYQSQGTTQTYNYTYTEALKTDKTIPVLNQDGSPVLDSQGNRVFAIDPTTRTLQAAYQNDQLYKASTSTVRSPGVTVSYDPQNAQFTLQFAQGGMADNITFQDPAHRTDFSKSLTPQNGVPNLEIGDDPKLWRTKGVQYLQADTGSTGQTYDVSTFFYELPGTTTQYVTYAGFVRNHFGAPTESIIQDTSSYQTSKREVDTRLERSAFVFGEQTPSSAIPKTGSASFTGNMIASMVNNPLLDTDPLAPSYFQWLSGTANVSVNFGSGAVNTTLTGTTLQPMVDTSPIGLPTDTNATKFNNGYTPPAVAVASGSSFTAHSTAQIDLAKTGGFTGSWTDAKFVTPDGTTKPVDIVGGTIDGAFYGPKAQEVGASFRIVGGTPDQRVDIIGSFTGK